MPGSASSDDYARLQHQPIVSKVLRTVAFDAPLRVLEVQYRTGSIYRFFNVPESVYAGLCASDSPGRYLQRWLKENRVRSKKLS